MTNEEQDGIVLEIRRMLLSPEFLKALAAEIVNTDSIDIIIEANNPTLKLPV